MFRLKKAWSHFIQSDKKVENKQDFLQVFQGSGIGKLKYNRMYLPLAPTHKSIKIKQNRTEMYENLKIKYQRSKNPINNLYWRS